MVTLLMLFPVLRLLMASMYCSNNSSASSILLFLLLIFKLVLLLVLLLPEEVRVVGALLAPAHIGHGLQAMLLSIMVTAAMVSSSS
jgi:hypothetical protein